MLGQRFVCAAVGLTVLAALAGCGSSSTSQGAGDDSSAREASGKASPCALLTSVQLRQLRFNQGQQQQATDDLGGTSCEWTGYPLAQGPKYTARLLDGAVPAGKPSASINNLPTVQYTAPGLDERTHCGFLITMPGSRHLLVQFADDNKGVPGISHPVACQKAQAAASDMASTYLALGLGAA